MKTLFRLRWTTGLLATAFAATPVRAAEVTLFHNPARFAAATAAHWLAGPPSADTAFPDKPFGTDLLDYSCTAAVPGVDLPFGSATPTANVQAPAADQWLCYLGPGWNGGLANIDPTPCAPTLVANGEDDYVIAFTPPVYAVGVTLLTNDMANETITLTFADASTQVFSDADLETDPNTFRFVGFKSIEAITQVSIDTTGGDAQNEGLVAIRSADFFRVGIDIKGGASPPPINCKSHGKIPVAILSEPGFDAPNDVDVSSLGFGATGDEKSLAFCNGGGTDLNGDGLADLLCHFETQTAAFCSEPDVRKAVLTGETVDGVPIRGFERIRLVPGSNNGNGKNGPGTKHGKR